MIRYFVWLQQALGPANPRAVSALKYFGSAENIFNSGIKERIASGIFTKRDILNLENTKLSTALEIMAECGGAGIEIIPFGDEKYPYCLSVIEDAPILLYVKGEMPDFDNNPSITIVGPRKVSPFGKKAAYSLGFRLAASGFTVVSGGALGTDTYAHAGALKAGENTVVVLGCGILSDYLPENRSLRDKAVQNGCLISEYPPNQNATRYTFPERNRIMSALTLGTIVVEAPKKSGALITARHAAEQGRDVFVIPGAPTQAEYSGSNLLLRDGAKPLLDVSDVWNEYLARFADKIDVEKALSVKVFDEKRAKAPQEENNFKKIEKKLPETLSKNAKMVYNYLDKQKFYPDDVSIEGLTSSELLSALGELEMEFLIKAIPGGMYELI